MKTNYQTLLSKKDANPILHKWRGGLAKLWSYTVSHKVLEIRIIDNKNSSHFLTILCGDVESIQGPTVWLDAELSSEVVGDGFIIYDRAAKFEVRAGILGVEET